MEGKNPVFPQEVLEYGHRLVWGANWKEEMQKYETSLLYDKSETYNNTYPPSYAERMQANAERKKKEAEAAPPKKPSYFKNYFF